MVAHQERIGFAGFRQPTSKRSSMRQRWWRWKPRTRRAAVLARLATAVSVFVLSIVLGVIRHHLGWSIEYGVIFALCTLLVGIPLDLARMSRRR